MFRLIAVIIFTQIIFIFPETVWSTPLSATGNVHFYGAVVNGACAINTQSLDQSVMMGQVRTSTFTETGSWAEPTAFWIKLENCDAGTSESASVAFNGLADAKDPQVFQAGFGSGAAKGVGIGIFDMRGNQVVPDTQPLAKMPLIAGENALLFTARYRSVSTPVTAGDASAAVTFSVIYQ
ncbi:fimbrial protein [Enterobacter asburiae]|uniref:fimbrial protein n=1 Tax=Enterobacter asburiae TaxID=61645 RepID=UPI00390662C4